MDLNIKLSTIPYLKGYKPFYGLMATKQNKMTEKLLEEIIKTHYPSIKNLQVSINEKGYKIRFEDKRYAFSDVYRVVRDYVLEKHYL